MPQSNLARVVQPSPPPVAPPPRSRAEAPARARQPAAPARRLTLLLIVATLIAVNVAGAPYYLLPMAERVRHPLHAWLRPSGYVGQSAGIVALMIFVFLWLYPLRKKLKKLAFLGSVGRWLDVHVTVALAMPLLLAIHAAWRFDGVIGLG